MDSVQLTVNSVGDSAFGLFLSQGLVLVVIHKPRVEGLLRDGNMTAESKHRSIPAWLRVTYNCTYQ